MSNRPLAADEREVLLRILQNEAFEGSPELIQQVSHTQVVGGVPTLLDLGVSSEAPRSVLEDGPIPVRAFVRDANGGTIGEVLVWVTGGYLSGLEYAWVTEAAPQGMPNVDSLVIEPHTR
jgi:hypothetical protein